MSFYSGKNGFDRKQVLYRAVSLVAQCIVCLVCADPISGCNACRTQYSEQERDHEGQGEHRATLRSLGDPREKSLERLIRKVEPLRVFHILTGGSIWLWLFCYFIDRLSRHCLYRCIDGLF